MLEKEWEEVHLDNLTPTELFHWIFLHCHNLILRSISIKLILIEYHL